MAKKDSTGNELFILISHGYDESYQVLMALNMTTMMADDKDLILYTNIHAVELLVNDAKDLMEGIQFAQKNKYSDFNKGRIIALDFLQILHPSMYN